MSKPIEVPGYEGVVWHESNVNIEGLKKIAKPRDEKAHEQWLKDYDDSFGQQVNAVEGRVS